MPRPKTDEKTEAVPADAPAETLVPFSVIVDGQDRTVFAKDLDDLQVRIKKLRGEAN